MRARFAHHLRAVGDERLLVRQRDGIPRANRRQRGQQAADADDSVEHDRPTGQRRRAAERFTAGGHAHRRVGQQQLEHLVSIVPDDAFVGQKFPTERGQPRRVAVCGQYAGTLPPRAQHVQRLTADRAGRPEDDDPARHSAFTASSAAAAMPSGRMLSKRSSTPPCPGNILP